MLYMFIATYHCPNGILGLGGGASENKLKDTSLILPMTNVRILSIFSTHALKEYLKVSKMKNITILYILALLYFGKLAMHLLEVFPKRHTV